MSPAKKSGGKRAAKKGAKKSTTASRKAAKKTGKKQAAKKGTGGKKAPKKTGKKAAKKAAASTKKTAKKGGQSAKKAKKASRAAKSSGKKGAKKDPKTSGEAGLRLGSIQSQDLIHGLAAGLVRIGEGYDRARDEVVASAARARRAASEGRQRVQEAGAAARTRLAASRYQETAEESIATARGVGVGALMRIGDARDEFLVRLADGTEELSRRARLAQETGQDFYARHREEILALTITAIKIAAVIGVRRLTAPRKQKDGETDKRGRKGDTVAIVSAVLGQVGQLLAHQPSALPLLREVYRKGDPGEQAVVGLLLGPTLHQDPEHALEVIEEFLEGASEEPAADTIARRTLAPLLRDHPEMVEQVTPWVRAAAPLVKRGALIALSTILRDRRSRVGDVVAAAVIVLEDHDEEVRDALSWFMQTASEVDLDESARAIAGWIQKRGKDVDQATKGLPAPLRRRVKDFTEGDGAASWDA